MTAPCSKISPPQTPHGSARSNAADRQRVRIGQLEHSDFACSSWAGLSANHRSGSSTRHGSSRPVARSADIVSTGAEPKPLVAVGRRTSVRHVVRIVAVDTSFSLLSCNGSRVTAEFLLRAGARVFGADSSKKYGHGSRLRSVAKKIERLPKWSSEVALGHGCAGGIAYADCVQGCCLAEGCSACSRSPICPGCSCCRCSNAMGGERNGLRCSADAHTEVSNRGNVHCFATSLPCRANRTYEHGLPQTRIH